MLLKDVLGAPGQLVAAFGKLGQPFEQRRRRRVDAGPGVLREVEVVDADADIGLRMVNRRRPEIRPHVLERPVRDEVDAAVAGLDAVRVVVVGRHRVAEPVDAGRQAVAAGRRAVGVDRDVRRRHEGRRREFQAQVRVELGELGDPSAARKARGQRRYIGSLQRALRDGHRIVVRRRDVNDRIRAGELAKADGGHEPGQKREPGPSAGVPQPERRDGLHRQSGLVSRSYYVRMRASACSRLRVCSPPLPARGRALAVAHGPKSIEYAAAAKSANGLKTKVETEILMGYAHARDVNRTDLG